MTRKRLNVNPTRMVLNDLQKRLAIATQGHKLLKEKQDSLIRQFMEYYDDAQNMRRQIETDFDLMNTDYQLASLEMDDAMILDNLQESDSSLVVEKREVNVFGLAVPKYEVVSESYPTQSSSMFRSHYRIDEMKKSHPQVRQRLIELAELEKTCFVMANEIKTTRRRVNALEHRTIPQIEETITYIRLRIDDQVRSQQARVMKVTDQNK